MSLARVLGLRDLVLLVVGAVIGSGIFLTPGVALRQVQGRVGLAIIVWLAAGVLSLLGALTYGELSARRPQAGGIYVHIRDCFGRMPAFLYGWTLFLVICSGSIATLAVAFATYSRQLVDLTPGQAKVASVLMVVAVAIINIRGTRRSANVQNVSTILKAGALIAMSVVLLVMGRGQFGPAPAPGTLPTGSLFSGFGLAMISALWAYEGWQYCTFSAGETINPQRTLPRAFLYATLALITLYVVANIAYVAALGAARASSSDHIAAVALKAVLGQRASKLLTLAILVSIFGAANAFTLTGTRVYYAMAADGLFFRSVAQLHPRLGTPATAITVSSGWAAVLALAGSFEQLLTSVVFSGWIFYALAAMTIFKCRRRVDTGAEYRVPFYPWTPLLFIAAAVTLVVNTIVAQPARAAVGMGIVLAGIPAYLLWSWRAASMNRNHVSSPSIGTENP